MLWLFAANKVVYITYYRSPTVYSSAVMQRPYLFQ